MTNPPTEPSKPPLWASVWFWLLLAALETAPFWFASIPPLTDLPGHAGRYHIMLDIGRSPYLQRFYGFHWAFIGNLGADLLMTLVGPILGAERGAWAIAAATSGLLVLAIYAVGRAVHGRVQPTAFLALPFVYAAGFEQGFLNYDLGVAAALLSFALWVALRSRRTRRAVLFVPLAFAVWVCHSVGWGLLGLLVGGYELQAALAERGWRPTALFRTAARVWPVALPALLIASVASRGATPAIIAAGTPRSVLALVIEKLTILFNPLQDRLRILDEASVPLVLIALIASQRWLSGRFATALAVPAALVGLAAILMPPVTAGIAAADLRIVPVAAIVLVLSFALQARRWATMLVVFALALTGLRLAVTSWAWRQDSEAYEQHLRALNVVPMGARILVLVPFPFHPGRPMSHLADLAIVRRDAFVNTQWAIAGAQLLQVKANADTLYSADPSQFVAAAAVGQTLEAAPLDHFDYAWVLGRYPPGPPPKHLQPVYADDETRLFRVTH